MRRAALVFCGPRQAEVRDEEIGPPSAGNLLVRTLVSAVSAGTELMAFRGELPADLVVDETLGALKGRGQTFTYPFRYGYAQVGEVIAVGANIHPERQSEGQSGWQSPWMGRRVFAFAPHASAFEIPVDDAIVIPAGIDPECAVLLAHAETAVSLLQDGQPLLGENVVVMGLGTIGWLTAALLARFPLATLAIVDRDRARLAAGRAQLGGRTVASGATARDIERALGGRGADLVYELTGSVDALNLAIAVTGHEGRIVVGSWYGNKGGNVELGGAFHRRRLRLIASQVSHIGATLSARWDRPRRLETAWTVLREMDTVAVVSHRFPFADAPAAYALLDSVRGNGNVGGGELGAGETVQQVLFTHQAAAAPS
jgi:2-desacetyl-2-hydroxyethyl bacteriochlorophyllide A dehydrogenase